MRSVQNVECGKISTIRFLPSLKDATGFVKTREGGGGGVLPEKLVGGVWPTSQNRYPIYDQNLRFLLPYL